MKLWSVYILYELNIKFFFYECVCMCVGLYVRRRQEGAGSAMSLFFVVVVVSFFFFQDRA